MDAPEQPATPIGAEPECNDDPKLTADEWAYIEAVTAAGGDA